ncbi:hypothetical protein F5882DRAFT_397831 [Hyaloscypha sp. PMI_1271]|nr:hypothetical protein F5882DRAFT_397831 [Hyaloscypha sp. PMI_1271]
MTETFWSSAPRNMRVLSFSWHVFVLPRCLGQFALGHIVGVTLIDWKIFISHSWYSQHPPFPSQHSTTCSIYQPISHPQEASTLL